MLLSVTRKIPNTSIARYAAASIAALWAMLGLASAYATGLGRGIDALVIFAVVINIALAVSAALAFVDAKTWRSFLLIAAFATMIDAIVNVRGTGPRTLSVISSLIFLLIVAVLTMAARRR